MKGPGRGAAGRSGDARRDEALGRLDSGCCALPITRYSRDAGGPGGYLATGVPLTLPSPSGLSLPQVFVFPVGNWTC